MSWSRWTEKQAEYLKKIAPNRSNEEVTDMMNSKFGTKRTIGAIKNYKVRLEIRSGLRPGFEKGMIPWNKGSKGLMKANKTSFREGDKPHNWRPVGDERVDDNGYVLVKISDERFGGKDNWRMKHRLVWEKENGPIPEGHSVIFGDGDKRNFDIDNLICITKGQLVGLNRGGLIKEDAELTRVGVNIVNMEQRISELTREVD